MPCIATVKDLVYLPLDPEVHGKVAQNARNNSKASGLALNPANDHPNRSSNSSGGVGYNDCISSQSIRSESTSPIESKPAEP